MSEFDRCGDERAESPSRLSSDMFAVNVAAVDVGSKVNLGWWHANANGTTTGGRDLNSLVRLIAADLQRSEPVALGFEAPLFIPYPPTEEGLNRQRVGERGRPWSAGAGTGALALGIQHARTSSVATSIA